MKNFRETYSKEEERLKSLLPSTARKECGNITGGQSVACKLKERRR
jgi:hypothetical protein